MWQLQAIQLGRQIWFMDAKVYFQCPIRPPHLMDYRGIILQSQYLLCCHLLLLSHSQWGKVWTGFTLGTGHLGTVDVWRVGTGVPMPIPHKALGCDILLWIGEGALKVLSCSLLPVQVKWPIDRAIPLRGDIYQQCLLMPTDGPLQTLQLPLRTFWRGR